MPSSFGPLVLIARAGRQRPPDLPRLERILSEKRLPFRVHLVGPGEGEAATRAALMAGERFLVAVGGDETVHEVVNGLFEDDRPVNPNAVLGLVPAGRDADFGRMFGLPED